VTKDKRRKTAIRAVQSSTGERYTRISRTMTPASPGAVHTFVLADLLAECATLPPVSLDWGFDSDYAPAVFASRLLGTTVPYGTVMELSGALAQSGPHAQITIESVDPEEMAVVVCGDRRFQLILSQDTVYDLCRTAGCPHQPAGCAIPWCTGHLGDCDNRTLAGIARNWGYNRREDTEREPTRLEGSPEADLIVKAAVARGAFEQISAILLESCFGDPNLYDDEFSDPADSLAMQHALERERLRLHGVARTEGLRIRKAAKTCAACGATLHPYGWHSSRRPEFCSPRCAPQPPAELDFLPRIEWFDDPWHEQETSGAG
jgi:hypothetical protein